MKQFIAIIIITTSLAAVMAHASGNAEAEALANSVLRDRLAITPRVGASTNQVFVREFSVHVYLAALETKDSKLKALVAMQILKDMPIIRRSGERIPTDQERLVILENNPQFKTLKEWYFNLLEEEKQKAKHLEQIPGE